MNCVSYNEEIHKKDIIKWFHQWEIASHIIETLPNTGLIVENVAAIFLYCTNSKLCFIESLISNREISKEVRDEAKDMLTSQILEYAKQCGYKYIASYSSNPKVVELSVKHGFNVNQANYKCFVRSL